MTDIPDDFADHPVSISEARANRQEGGSAIWTVRDCLISALRDIDSGKIKPTSIAIICATVEPDGTEMDYYQRCESTLELVGICQRATITHNCGHP